jgi:polyisoprenoid-binding protein YceI
MARLRALALVLGGWCAASAQQAWMIDANHSFAYFSIRHLMISTVRGTFSGINGAAVFDATRPEAASVEATIPSGTVNTGVAKRDEQMRGPDFFEIAKYPVMKFASRRVEQAGQGKLRITGDLTIRTVSKSVVLDIDGPPSPVVRDAQGRDKIGLSATTKISRKDFGIIWNEVLETGGLALADEVSITLDIELIRK